MCKPLEVRRELKCPWELEWPVQNGLKQLNMLPYTDQCEYPRAKCTVKICGVAKLSVNPRSFMHIGRVIRDPLQEQDMIPIYRCTFSVQINVFVQKAPILIWMPKKLS